MAYVGGGWRSGQAGDITGVTSTATVSSLSTSSAACNSGLLTQTVTGTGFANGDVIYASYQPLATTYLSATQLRTTVFSPMPDGGGAGTIPVGVKKAGQALSNTVNFTATAASVAGTYDLTVANAVHAQTADAVVIALAYLLAEDFTGTNGAAWNSTNWPTTIGTTVNIQSNSGHLNGNPARGFSAVTVTDFEMVLKGTWSSLVGRVPEFGYRVASPYANPTGNGYAVQIDNTSGGMAHLYRIPSYNQVAFGADTVLIGTGGVWFRVRVVGSNHKVRWWASGGSEGSTWPIDATDANYTTGRMYLGMWSNGDVYWDDLTVTAL